MSRVLLVIVCALLGTALSFHLGDHRQITQQAMKEYTACFPKTPLASMLSDIVTGNELEDINLWNKWVKGYAHFYNPYYPIKICKLGFCRHSADVRIRMLENDLRNKTSSWGRTVGAAIHHLQDMCSPPHVVPVMHASGDGFESYKNQQFPALVTNDCDTLKKRFNAIAPREFLYAMLNRTAIATLKTLSGSVSYQKGGNAASGVWSTLYWQNSKVDSNNFGTYGAFDNNYGKTKFTANGESITVAQSVYELYKRSQLRAAIDATKLAFMFADKLSGF